MTPSVYRLGKQHHSQTFYLPSQYVIWCSRAVIFIDSVGFVSDWIPKSGPAKGKRVSTEIMNSEEVTASALLLLKKQGRMVHKDKLGSFSLIVPAEVQRKEADNTPLPLINDPVLYPHPMLRKLDAEHADLSKALLKRMSDFQGSPSNQ